jgi:hypothetical protein
MAERKILVLVRIGNADEKYCLYCPKGDGLGCHQFTNNFGAFSSSDPTDYRQWDDDRKSYIRMKQCIAAERAAGNKDVR